MTAATRTIETIASEPTLFVSFELGESSWKLAFTVGLGQRERQRTIGARDVTAVRRELARAKQRFGLPPNCPVKSCYEAGREGFWLHRWLATEEHRQPCGGCLEHRGNRRLRRAKTDRMDATRLLALLVRFWNGEHRVWSVVRVPSVEEEDRRHLHRELLTMKRDRTRLANRIQGSAREPGASGGLEEAAGEAARRPTVVGRRSAAAGAAGSTRPGAGATRAFEPADRGARGHAARADPRGKVRAGRGAR